MFRSSWQQVKLRRVSILVVAIILVVVIVLIIRGYRFDWTGFNGNNKSGKTLWDWMQLLFIPLVLAIAGFWFNHRERKAAELRAENERKAAELRSEGEREIEQQRAKTERDIAEDNQREAALQSYINEMSEILLEKKLRESTVTDEVRIIARVRTLTVLPRLDGKRKRNLLLFLFDAGLIDRKDQIVDVSDADFSEADLSGVNLRNANLEGANLSGVKLGAGNEFELEFGSSIKSMIKTDLSEAKLVEADLRRAELGGADLHGADLSGALLGRAYLGLANLSLANLHGADLSIDTFIEDLEDSGASEQDISELIGANLHSANLSGANLSEANLSQAELIGANLGEAYLKGVVGINTQRLENEALSLEGATMPDGSIHE